MVVACLWGQFGPEHEGLLLGGESLFVPTGVGGSLWVIFECRMAEVVSLMDYEGSLREVGRGLPSLPPPSLSTYRTE